jgi:GNAT superfamily N-acetyltransferase
MHSVPFEAGAGGPAAPPQTQPPDGAADVLAELTGPCTLRDGVVVMVRPIRYEDVQRLQAFHLSLSPQTLYLRFGQLLAGFPDTLAAWLTCVDGDRRMAFVATDTVEEVASASPAIIGVARYDHVRPLVAEMAAVVADRWQGRGLGPQVLYRLAVYARSRGYTTFIGYVSNKNGRALHALVRGALPYTLTYLDAYTSLAAIDITHVGAADRPARAGGESGGDQEPGDQASGADQASQAPEGGGAPH